MEFSRYHCKLFFILLPWILFSIALIALGAMNIHRCPIQPLIPKYLIVAGITDLVIIFLQFLKRNYEKPVVILQSTAALFAFCWLIAGSVWVFEVDLDTEGLCHATFYYLTTKIVIIQISLSFVAMFIALFSICKRTWWKKSYERIDGYSPRSCAAITEAIYNVMAIKCDTES
ncbi:transmembrane protein 272-like [Discoglossus pictus]